MPVPTKFICCPSIFDLTIDLALQFLSTLNFPVWREQSKNIKGIRTSCGTWSLFGRNPCKRSRRKPSFWDFPRCCYAAANDLFSFLRTCHWLFPLVIFCQHILISYSPLNYGYICIYTLDIPLQGLESVQSQHLSQNQARRAWAHQAWACTKAPYQKVSFCTRTWSLGLVEILDPGTGATFCFPSPRLWIYARVRCFRVLAKETNWESFICERTCMKTVLVLLNKWSENIEQEVCKYEGMSGNYKVKVLQNYSTLRILCPVQGCQHWETLPTKRETSLTSICLLAPKLMVAVQAPTSKTSKSVSPWEEAPRMNIESDQDLRYFLKMQHDGSSRWVSIDIIGNLMLSTEASDSILWSLDPWWSSVWDVFCWTSSLKSL